MKFATAVFFWAHVAALALGLFGILFAIPHADLWTHQADLAFFSWALSRGGSIGMITGALVMLAWGIQALGIRRTLLFFALACSISAAAELTGTRTGWPFGGYEYLTFLDWKIAGRVPYGVPLSWFYMGFAAYALSTALAAGGVTRIFIGALLLTAWDLVLDPAMAAMPQIKFWIWHEHGPYYGMPLRNLFGWYGTGFAFIGLARLAWGAEPELREADFAIPFAVYSVNIAWSMILAISVGLWPAALAAVLLSLLPAIAAFRRGTVPAPGGA